jgi:hypothetical protein
MSTLLSFLTPQTATGPDALQHITNHGELAVQRLPAQFANSPNLIKLVRMIGNRFQGPEDALWQVRLARKLSVAVGQQLDQLGSLVGEPRAGKADATYRVLIAVRIVIDRSRGSGDDVIRPFSVVLAQGTSIALVPEPIAAFRLAIGGTLPTGFAPTDGERILEAAKAAGIRCVFQWDGAPLADMLVLDSVSGGLPAGLPVAGQLLDGVTGGLPAGNANAGQLGGALASSVRA